MRVAGQVRACPGDGSGTPYEVTEWLRQGVAPLAAAVHWERTHFPDDHASMARLDTETAFLLALPLLRMSLDLAGSCRMAVEMDDANDPLCGAIASVEDGRVISCTVGLDGDSDAWARGATPAWIHAMLGSGNDHLELGGDKKLARGLLDGLHGALFGAKTANP